jgi:hypothetical protein
MTPRQTRALVAGLGGALVVLGSFLPWITANAALVGGISRNGLDGGGDGIITLLAGIAIVVLALATFVSLRSVRGYGVLIAIVGGIAGLVGIADMVDATRRVGEANDAFAGFGTASVGAGLWTVLIGAAIALIGGLLVLSAPPAGIPASNVSVATAPPPTPPRLDVAGPQPAPFPATGDPSK